MHSCYILQNERGQTYNGYTVDFERRLRQHNCEIKGGAKYTCNKGPWCYLLTIESEHLTKNMALSLEWSIRYPTNHRPRPRKFSSPKGRVESLPLVLGNPKFAGIPMRIRVAPDHVEALRGLCAPFSHVEVLELTPPPTMPSGSSASGAP
jgi:predicted GIY-YIG superfamily endonuclease